MISIVWCQTSVFVPWHGSLTVVTVTSVDNCLQTIRLLLDKFKVVVKTLLFLCVVICITVIYCAQASVKPMLV